MTHKPTNKFFIDQARRTHKSDSFISISERGFYTKKFCLPVVEFDHTDGIGTKGYFHWKSRTFHNAVLDALAMNLNDLQMARVKPFKLQNHVFLPEEDLYAAETIATALADECIERNIVITGGECAIHNDMPGLEISITMSGFCEHAYPNLWQQGRLLVALPSVGIHSNGFTYIREMMSRYGSSYLPFRDEWLTPTKIYDLPPWPFNIFGIQHITGGAFGKLKERLHNVDLIIHRDHSLYPQEVFHEIYRCQWDDEIMYRTFNCGIGMLLAVVASDVEQISTKLGGYIVGEIRAGEGRVIIESMFSKQTVVL